MGGDVMDGHRGRRRGADGGGRAERTGNRRSGPGRGPRCRHVLRDEHPGGRRRRGRHRRDRRRVRVRRQQRRVAHRPRRADAEVVGQPELPNGSHQLLLDGDRLLVVTTSWDGAADTIVSLYDVSDPTNATLLRRSHLEGSVLATRSVDDVARLVISTSFDTRLPFVQPSEFGLDEERALERNRQIIAESSVEDWLPRWFDEAGDGTFGPMQPILDCNKVAAPDDFAGLGLTWIASVDLLGEATPVGSAGVVSTGDIVYSSADNLYITTQNWDSQVRPMPVDDVATGDSTDVVVDDGPAADADPPVRPRRGDGGHLRRVGLGARSAAQPVRDERVQRRSAGRHDDRGLELRRTRASRPSTSCARTARTWRRSHPSAGSARPSRSVPSGSSTTPPTW